jgi:hypothetical protein
MSSSLPEIKPSPNRKIASKTKRFLYSTIRIIIQVYHGYIRLHILSIIVALIIVIFSKNLRTIGVVWLLFGLFCFLLLPYLDKWLEKYE